MTMNRQRLFILLLSFLSFTPSLFAQEIDWSKTGLSVSAFWILPQKEFGQYWRSGPGLGAVVDVPMNDTFSFSGIGWLSWHVPSETSRKADIPQVLLFKLGVGLQARSSLSSSVTTSLGATLVNNAFIFTGPAAPSDFDNQVESEFGVSVSSRVDFNLSGIPLMGLIAAYEPIFTGPDDVATFSIGAVFSLY